jgi:hypothetical protein
MVSLGVCLLLLLCTRVKQVYCQPVIVVLGTYVVCLTLIQYIRITNLHFLSVSQPSSVGIEIICSFKSAFVCCVLLYVIQVITSKFTPVRLVQ